MEGEFGALGLVLNALVLFDTGTWTQVNQLRRPPARRRLVVSSLLVLTMTTTTARNQEALTNAGRHAAGPGGFAKTRWRTTAATATFPEAVRKSEEVVPVNISTWVLPSGVAVGR